MAAILISSNETALKKAIKEVNSAINGTVDEGVLAITASKAKCLQSAFEISNEEIKISAKKLEESIVDLVIEHVALLATQL